MKLEARAKSLSFNNQLDRPARKRRISAAVAAAVVVRGGAAAGAAAADPAGLLLELLVELLERVGAGDLLELRAETLDLGPELDLELGVLRLVGREVLLGLSA